MNPSDPPTPAAALALAFDFYGAGNIGDDLMMAGFLDALEELAPTPHAGCLSATAWDIDAQRRRFPSIEWVAPADWEARLAASGGPSGRTWVGVGGTPFQFLCGPWFLNALRKARARWGGFDRRVMVNIGAEAELGEAAAGFRELARDVDRISTRDAHTTDVLTSTLGVPAERLFTAADLANIALPRLLRRPAPAPAFDLGIILAAYMLAPGDVEAVGRFALSRGSPVAWLVNDVRPNPGHEIAVLRDLIGRIGPELRTATTLLTPAYRDGDTADLIAPIRACRTVLSSRYHGLLAAAWSGARIAAIGGASKVESLARELGVPVAEPPLTLDALRDLERAARTVERERLERLRELALRGVAFALRLPGA